MNRPTLEAIRLNPEILGVLEARARRARSQAIGNAFVKLIGGLKGRLSPLAHLDRLTARLG